MFDTTITIWIVFASVAWLLFALFFAKKTKIKQLQKLPLTTVIFSTILLGLLLFLLNLIYSDIASLSANGFDIAGRLILDTYFSVGVGAVVLLVFFCIKGKKNILTITFLASAAFIILRWLADVIAFFTARYENIVLYVFLIIAVAVLSYATWKSDKTFKLAEEEDKKA